MVLSGAALASGEADLERNHGQEDGRWPQGLVTSEVTPCRGRVGTYTSHQKAQ